MAKKKNADPELFSFEDEVKPKTKPKRKRKKAVAKEIKEIKEEVVVDPIETKTDPEPIVKTEIETPLQFDEADAIFAKRSVVIAPKSVDTTSEGVSLSRIKAFSKIRK